jgi:hypothetical protein
MCSEGLAVHVKQHKNPTKNWGNSCAQIELAVPVKRHENPTKIRGNGCAPIGLAVPVKRHENPTKNRWKLMCSDRVSCSC